MRAFAVLVVVFAVAFVVLRGGDDSRAVAPGVLSGPAAGAPQPSPSSSAGVALARDAAHRSARTRAAARRSREAARRAEARRLRRSRTVLGAVRRAWLSRAISRREYERLRSTWWRANRDLARLTGVRRAELGAVIGMARRLADARILTSSRLEPVFLTVRRNREFWTTRPLPAPNARLTFRGDPVVFQYYAGRGLAIQPLASFGKANALAGSCLRLVTRYTCRPKALRRLLSRMVALGTQRGGFLAWEYLVPFGSGAPPWISAMTQATGAQALARGRRALGAARGASYARAASRALGAFVVPPPLGIAVASGRGTRYTMYSFSPGLRIYNGELQALIGLRDLARLSGSARAERLYARGEPVARRSVAALDTGAWSLYSEGGAESTLSYHRLVANFLEAMCSRTGTRTYCAAGRRLERYVREPPRVGVARATGHRLRARRRAQITFTLSKISDVMVQVRDRRGRVEFARGLRLPRGRHSLTWVPALVGRHRLRIVAIGPAGTRAVQQRTLRAKAPLLTKKQRLARKRKHAAAKRAAARHAAALRRERRRLQRSGLARLSPGG